MHIEALEYFYKVAGAKSISKVANSAHISQSALSQQISKLEDSLGCQLLNRSNKGVELTEKGQIVYKYADSIVRTYDAMIEHLREEEQNIHSIKIEANWSITNYSMPCVMYKMKNKFPKNDYQLNSNEAEKIEENLVNGISDFGVIYGKPQNKELSSFKIGVDKLVLVSSPNYAIPESIQAEELVNYPFIMLNDKMYVKEMLKDKLQQAGCSIDDLKILYNSDSMESVKESVLNEFGIGFLPYVAIKKDLYRKELRLVNIVDFSIEYDMFLIYHKKINENPVLKEFNKYFQNIAQKSLC
ncbi:LysR family transcriptional regulator [Alkalibacter rhizosphaerae]|uniref:LysR family transcriptional regulator n=1 Tax=Alkalibacter rhizosphaerae TaxID=2815577 RepID=A0A975AIE6_9FIRM|nr:LysR family transcriptional regulator [Alkalibacter rhizosphaerae]QSX09397.1 LysR family transcriptional regulator [Alkalibacter rhizosphaerae]